MTGNKEPKVLENTSIDKLLQENGVIEPVILEVPDYSYGASQEPLNASYQVRNIQGGGQVKTGYVSIPSGYTDFAITGVGFRPKALQVIAQSSNKMAWGYADNVGGTLTQRCIYSESGALGESNSRLFRFSGTEVGLLVSMDNDGFTIKSDLAGTLIYTCFG